MAQINVLSQAVADKIAAGEVVERPAAVVKELVENSIDAGADRITVEIKNGGIQYISIEDNGKGIPRDELELAFVRHATSKLREIEDLFEIKTMGFRGEALASVSAVAEVTVVSRTRDCDFGMCMSVRHGVASEKSEIACNVGTTMVVENLFANIPARMKFLKKDATEAGYITDIMSRIALAKPEIAFRYISDGKDIFSTSGDGKLKNAILNIYGIDHARALAQVDYTEHGVRVHGAIGKAELARGNRTRQTLMVNGRYIKNHVVSKVIEEAYRNILMTGKFPFYVLNIEISPSLVDVNVHPAKTEIKFANEKEVYNIVHCAVKNALYKASSEDEEKDRDEACQSINLGTYQTSTDHPSKSIIRNFMKETIPTKTEGVYLFREPSAESFECDMVQQPVSSGGYVFKLEPNSINQEEDSEIADKPEKDRVSDAISFDFVKETETQETGKIRVIGQLFDTYIVAQKNDEMLLIDQHAAHERKRFEMLKADYLERRSSGQQLLSPIVLDADMSELQAVSDNYELLESIGFIMEEFGRGSIIIRETPYIGDEDDIKEMAMEVISALLDNRPLGVLSFEERILDIVSCRYAIKANKKLNMLEMEALVKDVEELETKGILTCPHGRPITLAYSKKELEKGFKRIL